MKYKLAPLVLLVFLGSATQVSVNDNSVRWDDLIRVTAQATRINPATSKPDYELFLGNTRALAFDPTTNECVTFSGQVPHQWKLGTDLEPHVHWTPTTTNTGTVLWTLEYTLIDIGNTFPATTTIDSTSIAASGTAYDHQYIDFPAIDMSSFTARNDVSIMIMARLCRNAAVDTYTGDVAFLELDFHGIVDSLGSQEEGLK